MPLPAGTHLGPYVLQRVVGAGGMGEVYCARDTRLDRTVAVKILPSANPDLRARFRREAKAIAALAHPHICTIFDVGQHDGTDYLVMEYLAGETLADRLKKGRLPLDQVLHYAVQIGNALDTAHRAGIVHRDVKPANIFLTPGGAKLLDFGLAKMRGREGPFSLTDMTRMGTGVLATQEGTIVGTIQYMAPEQVEGRDADARSDIFALGAVIYEMATGKRAFVGTSPASVIGALLKDDPAPVSASQPDSSPLFDHIVATCLAKDPEERCQTARDLVRELKLVASGVSLAAPSPTSARPARRERLAWIAGACSLLVAAIAAGVAYRDAPAIDSRRMTFSVMAPEDARFGGSFALSPDGRYCAFTGVRQDGRFSLWVRPIDSPAAQVLEGTDDASYPFWSPDGESIGFFAAGKLKKVARSGGTPQTLAEAPNARGGSWGSSGVILFGGTNTPLYRVSDAGGTATPATKLDASRRAVSHRWPSFLADGQRFLYTVQSPLPDTRGVYIGSLEGTASTRVLNAYVNSVYTGGFILYPKDGMLLAQPFDSEGGRTTGQPVVAAEEVAYTGALGFAAFSASLHGELAYRRGRGNMPTTELRWFDRSGQFVKPLGAVANENAFYPSIAHDGSRVAVQSFLSGTADLWIIDPQRGSPSRVTFDPASDLNPVWSPDDTRLAYTSNREGTYNLYEKPSTGSEQDRALLRSDSDKWATDWSADGRFLFYTDVRQNARAAVWMLPLVGDRTPRPVVEGDFDSYGAQMSPRGEWIAYTSNESGQPEVYVQSFPSARGKWQISTDGGSEPRWRGDGRELYYVAANGTLMVVGIAGTAALAPTRPEKLFDQPVDRAQGNLHAIHYAVTADGQSFLLNVAGDAGTELAVVINWTSPVKK